MEVTINTRHCSVPEAIRNQTMTRLERLQRFNVAVLSATVGFATDGSSRVMDIRLTMKGGSPVLGHGEGPTFRTALDRAIDRLQAQLKRRNYRHRSRRERAPAYSLQASDA
jgi:ribosomal subunit interface protein